MIAAPHALRGSTWGHARGYDPMVATAAAFHQLHPDIEIHWTQRSLKDFEDFPVARLAAEFDLIVLDHPWIAQVAPSGVLLPLDEHLPAAALADYAQHSVGGSHGTYFAHGHQWGLAIDAATPVAFWREDLLARHELTVPATWDALLDLARSGHVEIPAAPINCLMNFYSCCVAAGSPPFLATDVVAPRAAARAALARLRELIALCDPGVWQRNPISSHEVVAGAANTRLAYCPLAYGYSNYARDGFASHRLAFGAPPLVNGQPLRTTLGGAGLAISARSPHRAAAVAYAQFVADPATQRGLYTRSGGQPGHRSAWLDAANNTLTHGFFARTLPVLDHAFLRPRFPGYMHFQDEGAGLLHAALRGTLPETEALDQLDALYRHSLAALPLPPARL